MTPAQKAALTAAVRAVDRARADLTRHQEALQAAGLEGRAVTLGASLAQLQRWQGALAGGKAVTTDTQRCAGRPGGLGCREYVTPPRKYCGACARRRRAGR